MKTYMGRIAVPAFSIALAVAAGGCDDGDYGPGVTEDGLTVEDFLDDEGRIDWRAIEPNDQRLNGLHWNGLRWNGLRWNGTRKNGLRWNGLRWNGKLLQNLRMNGNRIAGDDPDTLEAVEGEELEGAVIEVDHDDGETQTNVEFRFTSTGTTTNVHGQLDLMLVEMREEAAQSWDNACENNVAAISLRGDWDVESGDVLSTAPDESTWACLGAALGDCAVWGYVPGLSFSGEELIDYHKACMKAKTADYCGVGEPHTENGHSVDFYDALNIMTPATVGTWGLEAMWGPDGAICMNFTRKLDYTKDINDNSKDYIGCEIPDCVDVNMDGVIDFDDYPEAYLADRTVPVWKTGS